MLIVEKLYIVSQFLFNYLHNIMSFVEPKYKIFRYSMQIYQYKYPKAMQLNFLNVRMIDPTN